MTITFACPHCGQNFDVDESHAGNRGPCAKCGKLLAVPDVENRFAGAAASDRFRFKPGLWGVLFAGSLLLMVVALAVSAISTARQHAHRNRCISNLKHLGFAMHNHHDVHKRLPLASTEPRTGQPGMAGGPNPAGFGWTVALLPFLEEEPLYRQLESATGQWQYEPFDPLSKPELATTVLPILKCSYDQGPEHVDPSISEYQEVQTPQGKLAPARSTYVAFAASHFTNNRGLGQLFEPASSPSGFDGNGAIPFPLVTSDFHQGLRLNAITDGTSKSVMLCETRERGYAAWIDGQATWVVGAWPGSKQTPTETGAADGLLGWPDTDTTGRTTLALDPKVYPQVTYLNAKQYGSQHDRMFGPSSDHTGGVVNHAFADGHVSSIWPDIDRNLYLRLISRDGGEAVQLP